MSLLDELRRQRDLFLRCPSCDEDFKVAEAGLFDATTPLRGRAAEHFLEQQEALKEARAELLNRKVRAETSSHRAAVSINIGKVVEKIAPSLPGFPLAPADCRSLFEPIDYVVFKGLSRAREVDALLFVDVKSGQARLGRDQLAVREAVECGRVSLTIVDGDGGGVP